MTLEKLAQIMGQGFGSVDKRFENVEMRLILIENKLEEHDKRFEAIEKKLSELTDILDAFLKRLTAHEEEFAILKSEVSFMKKILKDKLGVDVDRLRHVTK